ncbi:MAG: TIGR00270 family protein [Candidatus Lokiarchaeota archaeon]|nr:TIGR00270 family protein [Candidatus Lokiarchaeota archaeon]
MSKKLTDEYEKECPICGGKIWGRGEKVLIEGAKIVVCQSCAQFGVKIKLKTKIAPSNKGLYPKPKSSVTKVVRPREIEESVEIVSDYVTKIRKARNSRGLNQDQFAQKLNEKPSLLRRIEAGKVEPTIKLAKKIEDVYNIKLLKQVDEIEPTAKQSQYMKKANGSSLGDIAYVKKKKK